MRIAVVEAQRGDAGLSVGLAVETWLAQGHAVEVIACCTRSEFAPFSDADSVHANDRMSFVSATRRREDEAWVKLSAAAGKAGKLTLTDVNLKDAPLRLHIRAEDVFGLVVNPADKALLKIGKALERSRAEAVALPLGLDGHVDRLTAREAGVGMMGGAVALYEDMPVAEGMEDAAIAAVARGAANGLEPAFVREPLAGAALAEAVKRKRRLALCFDSILDNEAVDRVAGACEALGGRERLWVNAAWRRAGLALPTV